jgi:hypothetical protein
VPCADADGLGPGPCWGDGEATSPKQARDARSQDAVTREPTRLV